MGTSDYRLYRRLSAGGMGEVYLAGRVGAEGFERLVVLKRMLPELARHRDLVELFLDEARLMSMLSHRNIAQVFDLGGDEQGYFAAIEYVHGAPLELLIEATRARGEQIIPAHALDIGAQVAEALGYAHSARGREGEPLHVVHRDVSPQNILVSVNGDVKLIDFGVARSSSQRHRSERDVTKGKLRYMSPEQARAAQDLDGRSDLFALGIVLAELLGGTHPFERSNALDMMLAVSRDEPVLPSRANPALADTDALLSRLLAKNPADRPADGYEVHDALMALRARFPAPAMRLGTWVTHYCGALLDERLGGIRSESAPRPGAEPGVPLEPTSPSQRPAPVAALGALEPTSPSQPAAAVAPLGGLEPTSPSQPAPVAPLGGLEPTSPSQRPAPVALAGALEPTSPLQRPAPVALAGALEPTSPSQPAPVAPLGGLEPTSPSQRPAATLSSLESRQVAAPAPVVPAAVPPPGPEREVPPGAAPASAGASPKDEPPLSVPADPAQGPAQAESGPRRAGAWRLAVAAGIAAAVAGSAALVAWPRSTPQGGSPAAAPAPAPAPTPEPAVPTPSGPPPTTVPVPPEASAAAPVQPLPAAEPKPPANPVKTERRPPATKVMKRPSEIPAAPARPADVAHPSSAPGPAVLSRVLTLRSGDNQVRVNLIGKGRATLGRFGGIALTAVYEVSDDATLLSLDAAPWVIVRVNDVTRGKTPATIKVTSASPSHLELRRPDADPVELSMSLTR